MSTYGQIFSETANRLGIDDTLVIQKAESYYRVLQSKNASATLGSDEWTAIPYILLKVECQRLEKSFDVKTAAKICGLSVSKFEKACNKALILLQRSSVFVAKSDLKAFEFNCKKETKQLSIKIGCQFLIPDIEYILSKMEQDLNIETTRLHLSCVLFICTKLANIKVKVSDVWEEGETKEFKLMTDKIKKVLAEDFQELNEKYKRVEMNSKKRKIKTPLKLNSENENLNETEGKVDSAKPICDKKSQPKNTNKKTRIQMEEEIQNSGLNSMIRRKDIRETRAFKKFLDWKLKMGDLLKENLNSKDFS